MVPPRHTRPGHTVIAHVGIEVSQDKSRVPSGSRPLPRDSKKDGYSELVFGNGQNLFPDLKEQRNNSHPGLNSNIPAESGGVISKATPGPPLPT